MSRVEYQSKLTVNQICGKLVYAYIRDFQYYWTRCIGPSICYILGPCPCVVTFHVHIGFSLTTKNALKIALSKLFCYKEILTCDNCDQQMTLRLCIKLDVLVIMFTFFFWLYLLYWDRSQLSQSMATCDIACLAKFEQGFKPSLVADNRCLPSANVKPYKVQYRKYGLS